MPVYQRIARLYFNQAVKGYGILFSSVSEAITFAHTTLGQKEERECSVLITVGELHNLKRENGLDGHWTSTRVWTPFLEPRQIWFTETLFHCIDVDSLSWEEVGVTSTEIGGNLYAFGC